MINVKMKNFFSVLFVWSMLMLSGCQLFSKRSEASVSNEGNTSLPQTQTGKPVVSKTNALYVPEDPYLAVMLKRLENSINRKVEIEQYSKALPYFVDKKERIEFLRIEGVEDRQIWLHQHRFSDRAKLEVETFKEVIDQQDIAIGMTQKSVRKSWGDPESIESSGHPLFKNEKWLYQRLQPSTDGFRPEKKMVYFEAGKVIGWEVE